MLSYAKSGTARTGDWLNGFKKGKTQQFNCKMSLFLKKVEYSFNGSASILLTPVTQTLSMKVSKLQGHLIIPESFLVNARSPRRTYTLRARICISRQALQS